MRCEKVLGQLSLFLDEMLEGDLAAGVAQHLRVCPDCCQEFARYQKLQDALGKLRPTETPDYLYDLVNLRISRARQETWRNSIQSALEYWWSRIRTTEGMWYITRLTGVMATVVFFIAISSAMNPIFLGLPNPLPGRVEWTQVRTSEQLARNLQRAWGFISVEAQKPIRSSEPRINDQYMANFAQSASRTAHDDTVSVLTFVDRSGTAKAQNILEYPADDSLLSDFIDMINTAGWRPASRNGRAVDSPLVLTFSKIIVYD
ncbi:MAG: zf-HC2 domain-containing protein [Acidobacteriia bacterium]|nr:zf-HC2 domain-containing protein [Terriglobia bacterium]